uniref:Spliceosome-associated protein 145 n=1 Tax=Aegilops tauschii TaxID=37682 RepID=N1R0Q1_AEGTA
MGKQGIAKRPFQLPVFIAATGVEKMRHVKLREMKQGMLSRKLKEALGMPDGAPPPWLKSMQLYGPPPSYPCQKILGLNALVSTGDSFGDAPGEWGKPPIGEEEPLNRSKHWGEWEEGEAEEVEQEPMEDEEIEES